VDLDQLTVAAALPLQPGVTHQFRRRRLILDQILAESRAATIRLRHITSTSIFDSEWQPQFSYYLRNRTRSEAVAGDLHGMLNMSGSFPMLALGFSGYSHESGSGFSITSQNIRFPPGYAGYYRTPGIDVTPEWLSQAELVIILTIPAGSVSRTLEVTNFEIAAAPARPPG
jgi:hypothetical protein